MPGPVAYQLQSRALTAAVMSMGFDQVTPSSVLLHTHAVRVPLDRRDVYIVLHVLTQIVRQQEPHRAGGLINDGAGIAAGVWTVMPNDFLMAPGAPAIARPLDQHVNLPGIRAAVSSSFTECQHGALFRNNEGGNPVSVVAIRAADEDISLSKPLLVWRQRLVRLWFAADMGQSGRAIAAYPKAWLPTTG